MVRKLCYGLNLGLQNSEKDIVIKKNVGCRPTFFLVYMKNLKEGKLYT